MIEQPDKELLVNVNKALDAGIEHLDPAIEARLRQGRRRAMAVADSKHRWLPVLPRWVPAGSLAYAAILVVAVSLWFADSPQPLQEKHLEDVEVLTTHDHLEMYQDMDFYHWLAETHDHR